MSDDEVEFIEEVRREKRVRGQRRCLAAGRPGVWLTGRIREYRQEVGMERDSEPSEEEIRRQLKLPSREQVQTNSFKDPITQWVEVEPTDHVPWLSWNKDILPEVEVVKPPGWQPSTPPRCDIGLMKYKEHFEKENIPSTSNGLVPSREMALTEENSADDEEVVICDSACVLRTTMGALRRSNTVQEEQEEGREEDEETAEEGREDKRRRRARSVSSSPGRDISDFRAGDLDQKSASRDTPDPHNRREWSSPTRDQLLRRSHDGSYRYRSPQDRGRYHNHEDRERYRSPKDRSRYHSPEYRDSYCSSHEDRHRYRSPEDRSRYHSPNDRHRYRSPEDRRWGTPSIYSQGYNTGRKN